MGTTKCLSKSTQPISKRCISSTQRSKSRTKLQGQSTSQEEPKQEEPKLKLQGQIAQQGKPQQQLLPRGRQAAKRDRAGQPEPRTRRGRMALITRLRGRLGARLIRRGTKRRERQGRRRKRLRGRQRTRVERQRRRRRRIPRREGSMPRMRRRWRR